VRDGDLAILRASPSGAELTLTASRGAARFDNAMALCHFGQTGESPVMLRAAAVCLFALSALAQPARADWPFKKSSRHRRETAVTLPQAISGFLDQIGRRAPARAPDQSSVEFSRHPHSYVAAYSSARMAEQAEKYKLMVALLARANGVPPSLVHRVILRESGYNARAVNSGNYGLMQIRLGTARALGYSGPAEGLLDPETNMAYAVRYLAGAYRAAHGDEDRAMAFYSSGYHGRE
jgi:soluble lytic murein transglycosylase-like protein